MDSRGLNKGNLSFSQQDVFKRLTDLRREDVPIEPPIVREGVPANEDRYHFKRVYGIDVKNNNEIYSKNSPFEIDKKLLREWYWDAVDMRLKFVIKELNSTKSELLTFINKIPKNDTFYLVTETWIHLKIFEHILDRHKYEPIPFEPPKDFYLQWDIVSGLIFDKSKVTFISQSKYEWAVKFWIDYRFQEIPELRKIIKSQQLAIYAEKKYPFFQFIKKYVLDNYSFVEDLKKTAILVNGNQTAINKIIFNTTIPIIDEATRILNIKLILLQKGKPNFRYFEPLLFNTTMTLLPLPDNHKTSNKYIAEYCAIFASDGIKKSWADWLSIGIEVVSYGLMLTTGIASLLGVIGKMTVWLNRISKAIPIALLAIAKLRSDEQGKYKPVSYLQRFKIIHGKVFEESDKHSYRSFAIAMFTDIILGEFFEAVGKQIFIPKWKEVSRTFDKQKTSSKGVTSKERGIPDSAEIPIDENVIEVKVSKNEYDRLLSTHPYLDSILNPVDLLLSESADIAARNVVRNQKFINAINSSNDWKLAGNLYHSEVDRVIKDIPVNRIPEGWQIDSEFTIVAGRGGSRLDVFLRGPDGELIEIDWKTRGGSGFRSEPRNHQMPKHNRQVFERFGSPLTRQESRSWVDFVRPYLAEQGILLNR